MSTFKEKSSIQRSWPWWRWIMTGLNILALVLSSILSWHYLNGGSMVGCSGASPCNTVLSSRWSMIAGVLPVSGLAMGVYLAMLVAGFFIGPDTEVSVRHLAWKAMLILAGSVFGSAIWFIYIQKSILGDFCIYCMSVHITGLLLAAMIAWQAFREFRYSGKDNQIDTDGAKEVTPATQRRTVGFFRTISPSLIGLILVGILVAGQAGHSSQIDFLNGESQNDLPAIDYKTAPVIGSPDAPYMVSLLYDYDCPHCQKLHLMLDKTVRLYHGKLAFVLCPTPLNSHCNPYIPRDVSEFKNSCELARIGLAMWVAGHNAFHVFDNWMYSSEPGNSWHPRSPEAARAKAVELVGQKKFDAALSAPWIGKYMQTCIRIFGQTLKNGSGGVPKMILGTHWVIPEPRSANDLVRILQKTLDMPKP